MSFNVALALCSEDPKMAKNEAVKATTTALKHCMLFGLLSDATLQISMLWGITFVYYTDLHVTFCK